MPGAAALGLRWPAEWEPHAATWLAWPHNPDTWPGRHEAAIREFVGLVHALRAFEPVRLVVADAQMEAEARRQLGAAEGVEFVHAPTNDAWLRDTGPIFVSGGGRRVALDFRFDSWGGKYPPWDLDDGLTARLADQLGVERHAADFVLEGGSVDGNGRGCALTTESCLLAENREPGRTRDGMERRLAEWLGVGRVVWLAGGIEGDDTDGHVDDVARFVDAGTVVTCVEDDAGDPNAAVLAENLRRLRAARDPDGKPLTLVSLPMPPARRASGLRCPASYANFCFANGAVLVPTFGAPEDATALAILRELMPGREVVGVSCSDLVLGLGAIHCLSQQEPV